MAHFGLGIEDVDDEPPGRDLWQRPPRWLFHLAWVPPALGLLWATSSGRGVSLSAVVLGGGAVGLLGCLWLGRLGTFVVARSRGRAGGRGVWFLVAPAICGLLVAAIATDASFRLRWALSRGAFEDVVGDARWNTSPQAELSCFTGSPEDDQLGRVGLFEARSVRVFDGAALIRVGGSDDAPWGFAYLPDGWPDELQAWEAECFEWRGGAGDLLYEHLGGDWYRWDDAVDVRAGDSDPDPESKSNMPLPGQ